MGAVFAGRYELVDPIGRGGVGAVWRAWDHRRRRYVAAKVLLQSDAHSLLRFVREQALRIDHPHVLAPTSWAADDDKVLFTMDLVAGGSLVHLVGDYGPLPPAFVCTLLDSALGCAVHTTLPAGTGYTSLEIKVSFLRPVSAGSGPLTCTGQVVKPGRRVAFAEGKVTDGEGRTVATATGSMLVFPFDTAS